MEQKIGAPLNEYIKEKLIKKFDAQYYALLKAVRERKNMMKLNLTKDGDNNGNS